MMPGQQVVDGYGRWAEMSWRHALTTEGDQAAHRARGTEPGAAACVTADLIVHPAVAAPGTAQSELAALHLANFFAILDDINMHNTAYVAMVKGEFVNFIVKTRLVKMHI